MQPSVASVLGLSARLVPLDGGEGGAAADRRTPTVINHIRPEIRSTGFFSPTCERQRNGLGSELQKYLLSLLHKQQSREKKNERLNYAHIS